MGGLPTTRHPWAHATDHSRLDLRVMVAVAVGIGALLPALVAAVQAEDVDDVLVRAALPPCVVIAALVAPRVVGLAAGIAALAAIAYTAAGESEDRGFLVASALACTIVLGGRVLAGLLFRPEVPPPGTPAERRTTTPRREPMLPLPPPTGRPPEWARLSVRQAAVLDLAISGLTTQAIGDRLGINKRTVEEHLGKGYVKLEVLDRKHLVHACRMLDAGDGTG